ncbi:hypothetical protein CHARACLAT_032044 [Characodon lateralis]|uniref:Uncharacterized protein n=1 Tax=Characodon lateralis TaxID=208331 RepID=A0ABU7FAW4_9TELE|nr:hypothetical protein [Characodon lateralis]
MCNQINSVHSNNSHSCLHLLKTTIIAFFMVHHPKSSINSRTYKTLLLTCSPTPALLTTSPQLSRSSIGTLSPNTFISKFSFSLTKPFITKAPATSPICSTITFLRSSDANLLSPSPYCDLGGQSLLHSCSHPLELSLILMVIGRSIRGRIASTSLPECFAYSGTITWPSPVFLESCALRLKRT